MRQRGKTDEKACRASIKRNRMRGKIGSKEGEVCVCVCVWMRVCKVYEGFPDMPTQWNDLFLQQRKCTIMQSLLERSSSSDSRQLEQ